MLDLSNGKHEYGLFVRHKGTSDFRLDDGVCFSRILIFVSFYVLLFPYALVSAQIASCRALTRCVAFVVLRF